MAARKSWGIAGVAIMAAEPASACMLCHSSIAEQVRAALFAADFWSNLGAVAAPGMLLLAGVLALAPRCWRS